MTHWLTELRIQAGFDTVRSLADASGVDNSTLSRIEKVDGPQPTPATLKKIAPFLKVSYGDLMMKAGHLRTSDLIETPFASENSDESLEKDWPEIVPILRRAGTKATPEERKRIAKILRAAFEEEDD
jgi:transcriptional regulator with XRE-family HTH domain